MSDQSQGPGWWQASDGRWYPPSRSVEPPAPGWWLASDGNWYPPQDEPPAAGWWLASDGKWYPPTDEGAAAASTGAARPAPVAAPTPPEGSPVLLRGLPDALRADGPTPPEVTDVSPASTTTTGAPPAAADSPSHALSRARPVDPAPTASVDPRSPEAQIARRDAASRQDAKVLAAARAKAAQGALATLRAQIDAEKASTPAPASSPPAPAGAEPAAASAPATAAVAGTAPGSAPADGATLDRSPKAVPGAGKPLLEVRPSPVASDLDRLGERLAVYEDRVSMLDRHDNVRERIDGHEIADVVLSKRFTGWVVTIEAGSGETITVKGLRQDQAEEIRDLIMRRTRRTGPVPARPPRTGTPAGRNGTSEVTDVTDAATPVDRVRLLSMLDELHQARVLSDDELADKRQRVERLAEGQPLAPSTS